MADSRRESTFDTVELMSNVGEEGGVCNKKTMTIGKGREKEEEEEKMGKRQELGMGKDMCKDLFFFFLHNSLFFLSKCKDRKEWNNFKVGWSIYI